ncbi:LacI family transcriptional regulator [Streptomyces sp. RB6PN25]|uniref:LacI family transcriptional regulator n=1 Tax=Streptomyces humicola TaxID=2953240 RepID=A0ABT1PT59_9ACTN|nr:LacI family DNA-binding transcriptional regulator [Streptomyces humicola]MCQ4080859.1 LacI family transcriptional regulator [Streptomyces humicola]
MARTRGTVTIRAVAEAAQVSPATVSRFLAGKTVRPELAERVRAVVEELGFRPNVIAQDLAQGRTRTIGVAVPDLENPYFTGILKGIGHEAQSAGYHLLVGDSGIAPELDVWRAVRQRCDGIIICSPYAPDEVLAEAVARLTPAVLVNRCAPAVPAPQVAVDSHSAMLELTGHLMNLGHRRLAYLAGPEQAWSDQERRRALDAARHFGAEVTVVSAGATAEDVVRAVDEALAARPTALLAFNDLVAFAALARLRELGIKVPEDVSVTGFDDIPYARLAVPALTSVRSPQPELGTLAWQVLSSLLAGETPVGFQTISAEVQHRETVAPSPER